MNLTPDIIIFLYNSISRIKKKDLSSVLLQKAGPSNQTIDAETTFQNARLSPQNRFLEQPTNNIELGSQKIKKKIDGRYLLNYNMRSSF